MYLFKWSLKDLSPSIAVFKGIFLFDVCRCFVCWESNPDPLELQSHLAISLDLFFNIFAFERVFWLKFYLFVLVYFHLVWLFETDS